MIALHAKRGHLKDRHARDRAIMVAHHLEARGIADALVLAAMGKVPREAFVSGPLKDAMMIRARRTMRSLIHVRI
jgi:protein-L-isoaspartate O-methyltransferase